MISSKTYVSFEKEPCQGDDILQKRPMILWSLLIVVSPYPTQLRLYEYEYEYGSIDYDYVNDDRLAMFT